MVYIRLNNLTLCDFDPALSEVSVVVCHAVCSHQSSLWAQHSVRTLLDTTALMTNMGSVEALSHMRALGNMSDLADLFAILSF